MPLSDDEKKFAWFWVVVFASALGFWTIIIHWAYAAVVKYI